MMSVKVATIRLLDTFSIGTVVWQYIFVEE
jgi:hypothetical protein